MNIDPNLYQLSAYQFDLPQELIAQYPCTPRDHSRLMVIERSTGRITEIKFHELTDFLSTGDQLIFNNTKVIPARMIGKRESGGESEIFLTKYLSENLWEALVRPGKKLKTGSKVIFGDDLFAEIVETLSEGYRIVQFHHEGSFETLLNKYGQIPLPQYIQRDVQSSLDMERYQTVYASISGAVAAPTAGLHFTNEMLNTLNNKGVSKATVTLHVGAGTFRPVQTSDIRDHPMHKEHVIIDIPNAALLNLHPKRHVCVGTTSCRALESAASADGIITPGCFETNIFIYPGYSFKYVRSLLTNFHLPGSSLLMLVSAFAGYDLIKEAYAKAIKDRYRFFSYGDAMLILE